MCKGDGTELCKCSFACLSLELIVHWTGDCLKKKKEKKGGGLKIKIKYLKKKGGGGRCISFYGLCLWTRDNAFFVHDDGLNCGSVNKTCRTAPA